MFSVLRNKKEGQLAPRTPRGQVLAGKPFPPPLEHETLRWGLHQCMEPLFVLCLLDPSCHLSTSSSAELVCVNVKCFSVGEREAWVKLISTS